MMKNVSPVGETETSVTEIHTFPDSEQRFKERMSGTTPKKERGRGVRHIQTKRKRKGEVTRVEEGMRRQEKSTGDAQEGVSFVSYIFKASHSLVLH